jgi:diguanylate cyclase (GGDEF)-like protein/PAS domain S-box-containing protein
MIIAIEHWQTLGFAVLGMFAVWQEIRIYKIRQQARKREELFQIVTENAADMIALVDVKGNRLYNSPAYKRILGYSSAELGETSAFEQIHPDDRFKVLEAAREARSSGIGRKLEYRIRHKDRSWRVLESVAGTIRNEKGEVIKLVIVNRDITERKRAEELAEHNSFHDSLTGLPNRRLFLDRLQHLFDRARRHAEHQFAVLFVDLDGFRIFNDTMGPAVGDQVIVEIGQRLGACLRQEDTVSRPQDDLISRNAVLSRMGGDEFTILLENVTDPSDPMRVAHRILASIAALLIVEGREVTTSGSIGVALSTPSHKCAEDLLQDADAAMRRAKALGGGRCEVFDEAMHAHALNRLKLEAELLEALRQNEFRVCYQPVLDLQTKRILGFEALLRWQHPEQGLISPFKFINAAEDTGLLLAIGHWLIVEACRQLRIWEVERSTRTVGISVNLSARQFADARLIPELQSVLRETGIEPAHLQLEITEAVASGDSNLAMEVFSRLKQLGINIVLDDFGTGKSSLSELRKFPVDALKIDRSLIGEMLANRITYDTVDLILVLGQKLKVKVIAAGLEKPKQLEALRELGCNLGQGYLFSQAVDAESASKLLSDQNAILQAKRAGM